MHGFTVSWWRRVLRQRRWLQVIVVVCLGYILFVKLPSLITKVLRNTGTQSIINLVFFSCFSTILGCFSTILLNFESHALCLYICYHNLSGKLGNSVTKAPTTTLGSKASKRGMTSYPLPCDESVMSPKAHGTCLKPVQKPLRWQVDWDTADRICCFNRHYAEHSGYWEGMCCSPFVN